MVTQQILVLFFLVRVRVAQLHLQRSRGEDKALLGYGVMVTQQILVLFFLVRIQVAQQKKIASAIFFCFCSFLRFRCRVGACPIFFLLSGSLIIHFDECIISF